MLVSGRHAHSCSGAFYPCKNTPLYRKLLRGSCPACTQSTMSSIRRAKIVGRNEPYHLRSIFRLQITGHSPSEQQRCCSKDLNRNRALGSIKRFALIKKRPIPVGEGRSV